MNFILVVVYRPGTKTVTSEFIDDFSDLVERIAVHTASLIIVGDINLHLDVPSAAQVNNFLDLLSGADLIQHVVGPTHRDGQTLDVDITQSATRVFTRVDPPVFSDHSLISSDFFLGDSRELPQEQMTTSKCIWKELDVICFRRDLQQFSLLTDPPNDVTAFFDAYD